MFSLIKITFFYLTIQVFVCDKENDRICVFNLSGKFLRSFGQLGSNQGQFDKPYYIHISKDDKVFVSDSANHRIQVFGLLIFLKNYLFNFILEINQLFSIRYERYIFVQFWP
jgi:DNA-binding beta-propeller fold protein YncE